MLQTFKLVHKITNETMMYGTSKRVCRIYATKYSLALAHLEHDEELAKILNKPNQIKAFYKANLDTIYSIEEVDPIKVWTLNEVQAVSWYSFWTKLFSKKS